VESVETDKCHLCEVDESQSFEIRQLFAFFSPILCGLDDIDQFLEQDTLSLDDRELRFEFVEPIGHFIAALWRLAFLKEFLEPIEDEEDGTDGNASLG
jgi:hypothetical protein